MHHFKLKERISKKRTIRLLIIVAVLMIVLMILFISRKPSKTDVIRGVCWGMSTVEVEKAENYCGSIFNDVYMILDTSVYDLPCSIVYTFDGTLSQIMVNFESANFSDFTYLYECIKGENEGIVEIIEDSLDSKTLPMARVDWNLDETQISLIYSGAFTSGSEHHSESLFLRYAHIK